MAAIGPVGLIRDDVVTGLVSGHAFFGVDRAGRGRFLGPHRRGLQVSAWILRAIDGLVRLRKHVGINRIDIAVVVDQPVVLLRVLLCAPLPVEETVGIERQLNSRDGAVGISDVLPSAGFRHASW
jgi:hypothetical protein